MTVSMVRMAKARPIENQSERSDLPCHIINTGYYTVARGYEFYVRGARTISHE